MKVLQSIMAISLAILASSCASYGPLQRETIRDAENVDGTYTLYLMQDGPGTLDAMAAVADREGDGTTLVPAVSDYDLKTYEGLSLSSAIEKSREAFSIHCAYTGHLTRGLLAGSGSTVGYEIIPEYTRFMCESSPTVFINYFDKGNGRVRIVLNIMHRTADNP